MQKLPADEKERVRAEQRVWLKYRDSCDGPEIESCLLGRIDRRYQELHNPELLRSLNLP
jgi:uncharacterized protein YecT (DUF1311 family)